MSKPLEGFRILDFSCNASGPMFTQLLADFGAEVIKIESPPFGDAARHENVKTNGYSSSYASRNRGKKSIVLNMKDSAHKELFLKMVKTADAVVDNFKPGTLEKWGVGYNVMEKVNPKIVFASVSGYGQTGPYSTHAAYNLPVQAESGIMSITGQAGGTPTVCGAPVTDYVGGLMGCIGTLMGMLDARKAGHGRRIDASMMDATMYMYENLFSTFMATGIIPKPHGNRFPSASPIRDFKCKDGISIMINIGTDAQFQKFAEMLGQTQWLENPDYTSMITRSQHYQELEAEVEKIFTQYDSKDMMDMLQGRNLPWGLINDFETLKNHPQVKERQLIVDSVYPDGTTYKVLGNELHMSGVEPGTSYEVVPIGYNTIEVLSEFEDPAKIHEMFDPILEQLPNL